MTEEEEYLQDLARLSIEQRLARLERQYRIMHIQLATNAQVTQQVKNDTGELIEIFHQAKTGTRLIVQFATFVKWVGGFATAATATYYAYKFTLGHGQ